MRKRSDLFPKKYKRISVYIFSSWQEHLHPVYDMWWLMYHHDYWYGGWSSTWFKSGGTFCHHFACLVAFSATAFPFWWHFPPPWLFSRLSEWWRFLPSLCCFDGAFCPHFCILTALFAPTIFRLWFVRGRFLPPLCGFGGAFCPHFHVLGALFAPTLMKLHHYIHNNDFLRHHPGLCS